MGHSTVAGGGALARPEPVASAGSGITSGCPSSANATLSLEASSSFLRGKLSSADHALRGRQRV